MGEGEFRATNLFTPSMVADDLRRMEDCMTKMGRSISIFMVLLFSTVSLSAQWLKYPTSGIPRTRDGKPNLSARAPRTSDGKADLSGIWNIQDASGQTQFLDIAPSVPGGLPYRPGMAGLVKARSAPPKTGEPITRCLPIGIVERHTWIGGLKKVVQTPGLLLVLNEYNSSFRQIFTDGRPLPTIDQTAWDGYSTGKWEGDTLVVQTTGFRDGQWLDTEGNLLTDAAKVTERFHRPDFGHLEVEITVDDPKTYTKPFTFKVNQILVPDTELIEFICLENEKDIQHMNAGTKK
jgi:hypothetical protein